MKTSDKEILNLESKIALAKQAFNIEELDQELKKLELVEDNPDFWQDPILASKKLKRKNFLFKILNNWNVINQDFDDIKKIQNFSEDLELIQGLIFDLNKTIDDLLFQKRFSKDNDQGNCILEITSGVGGLDAMDFAMMLKNMYQRYCSIMGWKFEIIEEHYGDEGGLKTGKFQIIGNQVYGYLKTESGVHRLVRQSPFNAKNLRQTSFALVQTYPDLKIEEIVLDSKDLLIDTYRASGAGGQHVNTTDSAVRITHKPTGIVVSIQNERSQLKNKELALSILYSKLQNLVIQQHLDSIKDLQVNHKAASWGEQIRNYVLHPYKQVKDLRSGFISTSPEDILAGNLSDLIHSITIN